MSQNHFDLDDIVRLGSRGVSPFDGGAFIGALRKLAAPGLPAPDQDLAQHEQKLEAGDEALPADAEALYEQAQPDTSGHLEGEFAVPVDQVVMTMAQLVSHELKLQLAYLFYAEMLRGLNRDLAEEFEELAEAEINDAKYLLRRISVLMPGGVQVPVPPSPTPMHDSQQILDQMISGEQQAIVLLKALLAQMGENPMKFTVEQMLSEEQGHLDRLWQYMPPDVPEKQASAVAKIANVVEMLKNAPAIPGGSRKIREGGQTVLHKVWDKAGKTVFHKQLDPKVVKEVASGVSLPAAAGAVGLTGIGATALGHHIGSSEKKKKQAAASAQPLPVPAPGMEPVEHYLLRQQQLQLQQSQAETQDMAARLQQTQELAAQHQMAAEQAGAAAQQASQQAEMAGQQAAEAQQQATAANETATSAQTDAANQAEAKMRLSMRIQQLRQQLADIASQDPVAEEGLGMGGEAGPGGPITPQQQQAEAQAQAEQEQAQQMAAEQEQAAATGGPKAKKEVAQAQKAQQNAQVQTQQAQQAEQGA